MQPEKDQFGTDIRFFNFVQNIYKTLSALFIEKNNKI